MKQYTKPEIEILLADTESLMLLIESNTAGDGDSFAKGEQGNGHFTWGNLWADEDFAEDEDLD